MTWTVARDTTWSVFTAPASRTNGRDARRARIQDHLNPTEFVVYSAGVHHSKIGIVGGQCSEVRERILVLPSRKDFPHRVVLQHTWPMIDDAQTEMPASRS